MDLALDEDQAAFAAQSRRMLERVCPPDVVRHAATPEGPGHSDAVWRALSEAGWLGIPFDPEHDGAGATLFDLGLAFREAGRALVPTTLSSTITAGLFLSRLGTAEQKERWLRPLCRGALLGTVALCEPEVIDNLDLIQATADTDGANWIVNGVKAFVPNAMTADLLLVLVRVCDGGVAPYLGLCAVQGGTVGVTIDPYLTFGQDAMHEVAFDAVILPDDALLGGPASAAEWAAVQDTTSDDVRALRCMEMLGGIEAVLDKTARYAAGRRQFGAAIGSFQAVQHHLADVAMRLEAGRIAAFRALWTASERRKATREVIIAENWLSETYVNATLVAHQVWGGMGYALESDLYLWSQRAKTLDLLVGRRANRLEKLLSVSV